jgi:hypothetical protein
MLRVGEIDPFNDSTLIYEIAQKACSTWRPQTK